jgi:hypothetical protein
MKKIVIALGLAFAGFSAHANVQCIVNMANGTSYVRNQTNCVTTKFAHTSPLVKVLGRAVLLYGVFELIKWGIEKHREAQALEAANIPMPKVGLLDNVYSTMPIADLHKVYKNASNNPVDMVILKEFGITDVSVVVGHNHSNWFGGKADVGFSTTSTGLIKATHVIADSFNGLSASSVTKAIIANQSKFGIELKTTVNQTQIGKSIVRVMTLEGQGVTGRLTVVEGAEGQATMVLYSREPKYIKG